MARLWMVLIIAGWPLVLSSEGLERALVKFKGVSAADTSYGTVHLLTRGGSQKAVPQITAPTITVVQMLGFTWRMPMHERQSCSA